jgi:eukaryotic-like serine/threonine-protein kinase
MHGMDSPIPPDHPDPDSIAERLKQRFGDEIGPTLPLDPEPAPDKDAPSTLFDKLRGAGPRGTRYRLLGEVARGGMGVILKIWDDELRRTLAMKVVLGRGDEPKGGTPPIDPKTLGRFLEEAQVTGQLDHPGIVPVHELGLGEDGQVYFTMRLVKGVDLRSIFEKVRAGEDAGTKSARST